jgi:hypothetical protein
MRRVITNRTKTLPRISHPQVSTISRNPEYDNRKYCRKIGKSSFLQAALSLGSVQRIVLCSNRAPLCYLLQFLINNNVALYIQHNFRV